MAQLKDTMVAGDLSVTGAIYGDIHLKNLVDADNLKAIEALTGTSGMLTKVSANTWTLTPDSTNNYIAKSIGTAAGDIIYGTGSGTPARLAKGSNGQVLTLANGVPSWATISGSGGTVATQSGTKIYYATCPTAAATAAKVATTSTGDFELETGAVVIVKFTYANTRSGISTLNVDNKGAKNIVIYGTTTSSQYHGFTGEVVTFVYDGTNFVMDNTGIATTTYYGVTRLNNTITSQNTTYAATANAAYLASQAVLQNAAISANGEYSLLGAKTSGSTAAETGLTNKLSGLTYNPSTQLLTAPGGLIAKHDVAINSTVSAASSKAITFYDNAGTSKIGSIESLVNTDGTSQLNFTAYDFQDPTEGSVALSIIKGKSGSNSSGYVKISYSKVQDFAVRNIAFGSTTPTSSQGENGDVYIKI